MIWWVVAGLVIVLGTFGYAVVESDYFEDVGAVFIATTFLSGLVATLANLAFMQVGYQTATRNIAIGQLQNIRDGQGIHGSFFLGTGTVNSYPEYTYYLRNGDGSYALQSLSSDHVKVWQDDSPPRLECVQEYLKHDHSSFLSIFPPAWGDNTDDRGCLSYAFHVPPGSIVNNYTLGK